MEKKKRVRKTYSPEFKQQAVELVQRGGRKAEVAKDLGIANSTLGKWCREAEARGGNINALTPEEKVEFAQLKKENRVLRQERDILKKSVAFFVKDNS